jgi:hypothetical protein
MAKPGIATSTRGRSFSGPESLPKTKVPPTTGISGLPGTPAASAGATVATRAARKDPAPDLDVNPGLAFRIEKKHPFRHKLDTNLLVEIADKLLIRT